MPDSDDITPLVLSAQGGSRDSVASICAMYAEDCRKVGYTSARGVPGVTGADGEQTAYECLLELLRTFSPEKGNWEAYFRTHLARRVKQKLRGDTSFIRMPQNVAAALAAWYAEGDLLSLDEIAHKFSVSVENIEQAILVDQDPDEAHRPSTASVEASEEPVSYLESILRDDATLSERDRAAIMALRENGLAVEAEAAGVTPRSYARSIKRILAPEDGSGTGVEG